MNKYKEAFEKVKDACVSFDTVDELILLKELVEKATPKKIINKNVGYYIINDERQDLFYKFCPNCGVVINSLFDKYYCENCGQRFDWSEEDGL